MKKKWRYYLAFLGLLALGLSINFLLPLGLIAMPDFELKHKWEKVEQAFIDKSIDVVLDKSEPYPFAPVLAYNRYYYERLSDPSLPFPEELFLSEALIKDIKKNLLDEPYEVVEVNFNFHMMKTYSVHARVALTKTFTLKKKGKANSAEYYKLSLNEAYLVEKVGKVWKISNVINDVHPFYWGLIQMDSATSSRPWTNDRYENAMSRYGNPDYDDKIEGLLVDPKASLVPIDQLKKPIVLRFGLIKLTLNGQEASKNGS